MNNKNLQKHKQKILDNIKSRRKRMQTWHLSKNKGFSGSSIIHYETRLWEEF